jgi:hypothetical protein
VGGGRERPGRLAGGRVSPAAALGQAADRLTPPYAREDDGDRASLAKDFEPLRLVDPEGRLPAVVLSMHREQRLFSRTFPLRVEAEVPAPGPAAGGTLAWEPARPFRRSRLRWVGPAPDHEGRWRSAVSASGLVLGAERMTSVQRLELAWSAGAGTSRLSMLTLAGSMIGAAPAVMYAVPMEDDDVAGVLMILRALATLGDVP